MFVYFFLCVWRAVFSVECFLHCSLPYFLKQVLIEPGTLWLTGLTGQKTPGVFSVSQ